MDQLLESRFESVNMNLLVLYAASVIAAFIIDGYAVKFLLFGLIHGMFLVAALYADDINDYVMTVIKYTLFFAGNAVMAALFIVLAIISWWALRRS